MPAYKDKNAGTWYASFWYTDWTGARLKKMKRGFSTRRAALQWERDFLEKAAGSPEMTFQSLYELYMTDCRARLRATTYANKAFLFETHILPHFKDRRINAITPADIRKWQNEMISKEFTAHDGGDERRYSKTYLKTIHNQISAAFNFAVKYYNLPKNPARLAGSMGKKSADAMHFWTPEEFARFLAAIPARSPAYVAFSLLFWSGMRIGELLALTPVDFDKTAGTIRINKSYSRLDGCDIIGDPKTPKSSRTLALPSFCVDMLADYISRLYKPLPSDRLFEYTKSWMNAAMIRGCERAGMKKIRIHDLRHSHASLLIDLGFSPLMIRDRLGHENIETTLQTYSHLYPTKERELIEKLDALHARK